MKTWYCKQGDHASCNHFSSGGLCGCICHKRKIVMEMNKEQKQVVEAFVEEMIQKCKLETVGGQAVLSSAIACGLDMPEYEMQESNAYPYGRYDRWVKKDREK